ncbi:MAG: cation transporter [Candidatus Spechtbacterales bacterium]
MQVYDPGEVAGKYMIIMAPLDIVGDIFLAVLLIRHKGDTTAKAVFVDTSIDILASMGVIAGGIVILFTGYYRADGIAAIPIALIALYLARQTIRDTKKAH